MLSNVRETELLAVFQLPAASVALLASKEIATVEDGCPKAIAEGLMVR